LDFDEITLDCKELEAPEPINLIISKLSCCDEKTYIKMVHRIEPVPLLTMLESNNYSTKVLKTKNDVVVYIWQNGQNELYNYIKGL